MNGVALEFQGATTDGLLPLMAALVSAVLAVWGAVHLPGRQRRIGLIALAAALGPPLALAAVVTDAAVSFARGRSREARRGALACGLLAVLNAAGVALALAVPDSLWMAVLAVHVAVAVGVIYASVFAFLGGRRLGVLMALRFAAITALLLVLYKPVLVVLAAAAHKPQLPIVLDASASMATTDDADMPTRFGRAVQMLRSQQSRIERHFRPVWISFAATPSAAGSLDALADRQADGEATDLALALQAARDPATRQAGVILLSDGIDNGGGEPKQAARELGLPVCAVGIGSRDERAAGRPNLRLLSVEAPTEAIVNNVTELTARVRITRFPNAGGEIRLYEGDSPTPVAIEKLWTAAADETVTARLRWTPRETSAAGDPMRRLRVQVAPSELEASTADNSSEMHVLLTNPKLRVLYIEGSPRPEYKFLRRALATDPNVQLLGLVRVRENRFFTQGGVDGRRLEGLPATAAEFGLFDVVVLGSLDRAFLPNATVESMRAFVNDGGGLLMLGGEASFGPGGYGGTAVEAMLPVEVGGRTMKQVTDAFLPQLTAAGEAHPVFEGIAGYFTGPGGRQPDGKLAELPPLTGCVDVVRATPTASTLAVHPTARNAAGPVVVLAVQPYGAGRTAAFTADTTWQWYMPLRPLGTASPYHRFWGQLIRWLAHVESRTREAGAAALLRLPRTHTRAGEALDVLAKVQDTEGQPARNAAVNLAVHPVADGRPLAQPTETLTLVAGDGGGTYRGDWTPKEAGEYVLRLAAVSSRDEQLGTDELPVTVERRSRELQRLARNDELLRDLAVNSAGQYADITGLPDLLDNIIDRQRQLAGPPPKATVHRLYHFPLLFIAFVAMLTGEWVLRRRWQLQ
ncbi:MAG: hypothetical protein GVY16_07580 [Planctomycetes bacterium]|jgi:uncharacterized membrane protein|nr:hypothetical protein [Planctomycetota bacterium]